MSKPDTDKLDTDKLDTDKLGKELINILTDITNEMRDLSITKEILEEPDSVRYSSFNDIIYSMALKDGELDLISADSPATLTVGWADINSEQVWEIHVKNLRNIKKSKPHIVETLWNSKGRAILAKAMSVVCNMYNEEQD